MTLICTHGKFDVSSRRGKATTKGNTVYVTKNNFKKYANARMFYCYKNDRADKKENTTTVTVKKDTQSSIKNVNYRVRVTSKNGLNARTGAGTNYKIKTAYDYNKTLKIVKENKNWGKTDKGYWICLDYTKKVTISKTKTMVVSSKSGLNIRSGRGTKYKIRGTYKYKTKIKVTDIKSGWGKTSKGYVCVKYLK